MHKRPNKSYSCCFKRGFSIVKKRLFISFLILLLFSSCTIYAKNQNGLSTEELHRLQVQKDDEILAKDPSSLTVEEQERLKQIKAAQTLKRSRYEQRAMRKLANEQLAA